MEICTIGGYEEVGKNMTAVKIKDDVIIFDAGVFLPPMIELQETENQKKISEKQLREVGALPDDSILKKMGWDTKVRAIIVGHAHLDHVGGIPFIAKSYPHAKIMATPFTFAVLDYILDDEGQKLKNHREIIREDATHTIHGKSGTYKIEFIRTTHSTLQCVFAALHTTEGVFFYALDFKFDIKFDIYK